jgi:hypothetical protein
MLAGLAQEGLAAAVVGESTRVGGNAIEVVRFWITLPQGERRLIGDPLRRSRPRRLLAVRSPQRQALPDDGSMEVHGLEQAFIIEIIQGIVKWRRTLAVTDEHEAAGQMF